MILQVFSVKETSYRYGDEDGFSIKRFTTEDLANKYYLQLYESWSERSGSDCEISTSDEAIKNKEFDFSDGGKWSYFINIFPEEIEIIES